MNSVHRRTGAVLLYDDEVPRVGAQVADDDLDMGESGTQLLGRGVEPEPLGSPVRDVNQRGTVGE